AWSLRPAESLARTFRAPASSRDRRAPAPPRPGTSTSRCPRGADTSPAVPGSTPHRRRHWPASTFPSRRYRATGRRRDRWQALPAHDDARSAHRVASTQQLFEHYRASLETHIVWSKRGRPPLGQELTAGPDLQHVRVHKFRRRVLIEKGHLGPHVP